ncbi:universal stress protein [Streptacidiphilus jiangxiensis]|uniref:Nucleotide-binding universal stress protein, UspA family n=1 Tax=Streptacidiphilus jiangxiensis TaxID=235985 RepID=A0A1H7QSC7_STRJI|nr:universal stress protein [Streptacidiphilus jiangxiensis]SEL50644.1 Nucleotide-binding universal stress protein, UspA family [Streptacidiphilus jiangxiensis]
MALPLIVGFDGSKPSLAAAEWAATEATMTGAPLRLVLAHWPHREGTPVPDAYVQLQNEAVDLLTRTVEDLRTRHLGLQVDYELLGGEAPTQLLHAAERGNTLVLGSRGTGGFAGLLLGSTALSVAARAEHPVVLVRDHADPRLPRHGVVLGLEVGQDEVGQDTAPVVEFALAEAERRRTALRIVHAWLPSFWWALGPIPPGEAERTAVRADVTEKLRTLVEPLAEKYPDVKLHFDVRTGSAAHVLVDEAEHAALLVLGRRRHRAVSAIGPAAHAAIHYGHSAVAIVPHA